MHNADVDCGTMRASPHPLLASHQCHCDGTTLHHDMISYVQDEWICIHLHIPTTMTFRIFMDGTITLWMIFPLYIYYSWFLEWLCFACIARQIFFANGIQMTHDRALLWISMANPFLWMTAARCANAVAGISSGCVLARGKMSLASEYRNVLRFADVYFCLNWTWQVSQ